MNLTKKTALPPSQVSRAVPQLLLLIFLHRSFKHRSIFREVVYPGVNGED